MNLERVFWEGIHGCPQAVCGTGGLEKPCSQDQVTYPYSNLKNRCSYPHFPAHLPICVSPSPELASPITTNQKPIFPSRPTSNGPASVQSPPWLSHWKGSLTLPSQKDIFFCPFFMAFSIGVFSFFNLKRVSASPMITPCKIICPSYPLLTSQSLSA